MGVIAFGMMTAYSCQTQSQCEKDPALMTPLNQKVMKIKATLFTLIAAISLFSVTQAASIVPVNIGSSQPANQGDGTTTTWVNTFIDPDLILLAKWTPTNSWSSLTPGVSSTNFTVTQFISGNSTATVNWNLTGTGFGLFAILGSQSSSVNLNSVLSDNFVGSGSVSAPGNGNGWSHISFFGRAATPTTGGGGRVPDGGTTLLSLGIALLGLGSMKKLVASKA